MFSRLYHYLALYFVGIITVTLLAVSLLFYFTEGKPLAREVHASFRSHTQYLATLIRDEEARHHNIQALAGDFDRFTAHYHFEIALFNTHRQRIIASSSLEDKSIELSEAMFERMDQAGIFVQSSHFGRPLIYMLPVELKSGKIIYLFITKNFQRTTQPLTFLGGLALIGLLLTLAAYPLSKNITRPLTLLGRDFEKIAAGKFQEVPESARKDEIGRLIRGYRAMSRSVCHMIHSRRQLLSDISHELCSPLGRIRVGIELVKERTGDKASQGYLERIETDIASMDHLIDNLAAFSRMNLPDFSLDKRLIGPRTLVEEIRDLYLPSSAKMNIRLATKIDAGLPDIQGDFERLKRVFTNLMDNALRHTDTQGEICLGAEQQGDALCFFVENQGPGVPESDVEKIFEPFYRVDSSRNRDLGGTGIGLALSRKIVELHGGQLCYTRSQGRTRFAACFKGTIS